MIRACSHCGQKNRVPAARLVDPSAKCGRCGERLTVPAEPLEVNADDFKSITSAATVPVLVDFWAAWCGPCRLAAPEVAQVARNLAGKTLVLKVDTEQEPELAAEFGIRSIPHLIVFRHGEPVFRHAGLVDHRAMQRWLMEDR